MAGQGLARREVLRIMATAAIAAQFPGFKTWAFACGHGASVGQIKPAAYKPQFFSDGEYAVVEKLTELIIPSDETPGAREAGVAEFVDFMISRDTEKQYAFRTGVTWINAHAETKFEKKFVDLTHEQQVSLLEPLAYKAKFHEGEEDGQAFFKQMKEMTAIGFYTSEIGYKEIENPALKFYAESPACPHVDDREHRHLPAPKW